MRIFCDSSKVSDKSDLKGSASRNSHYRDMVHQHDFDKKTSVNGGKCVFVGTYSFPNVKQYAAQGLRMGIKHEKY